MSQRTIKVCSVEGCEKSGKIVRKMCSMHYQRWKKHGTPHGGRHYHMDPESRFAENTQWENDCLVWTGGKTPTGYGTMRLNGEKVRVHRYAWERVNGPIPDGIDIDHICFNRSCVNYKHLRVADKSENASNMSYAKPLSETKVRNVYPYKLGRGGYQVILKKHGKYHYFGIFSSVEEATVVAEQARKDLFGDFAGRG